MLFSTAKHWYESPSNHCLHALDATNDQHETLDPRADSFDILHYHIEASFLDFANEKSIDARTDIKIHLLKNTQSIRLDLLGLFVDSVQVEGSSHSFTYTSPRLSVNTGARQAGDTIELSVFYRGFPKKDASWGGFYFTGQYAFNMGVGFAADPHGFGRVWFPCMDNFTDKATYTFSITVDEPMTAYCNGLLQNVTENGNNTRTFDWKLNQSISTYLASVAIAEYESVPFSYNGLPVSVSAMAQDTSNVRSSFENLPKCIEAFVQAYGEHHFDRVGFNLVPFNAGAMEHATNIAYPIYAVANGSKNQERLFAHELAHHWWGDNTTCNSQEEMWLNEGWASYSEAIFFEYVYGEDRYHEKVRETHINVLQYAHTSARDGSSLPVSGIGHSNTYGMHVYQKGADMVHTLRGIMGDSAFFEACREFQSIFRFESVTTDMMYEVFNEHSRFELKDFFEQWVKTEGFCHFYIFSAEQEGNGYTLRIKQDQRFNDITYKNMPYTLRVYSKDLDSYDTTLVLSGLDEFYDVDLPFDPVAWILDPDGWVSDAITDHQITVDSGETGSYEMPDAFAGLDIVNVEALSYARLENHWVQPDHFYMNTPGLALHTQRYWTFDGVWDNSFEADLRLNYNGLGNAYLDNELIRKTEDSLVLMYRPNAWSYWQKVDDVEFDGGSKFDRRGTLTVRNAAKGQYALAMFDYQLIAGVEQLESVPFKIHPNPASTFININYDSKRFGEHTIEITDQAGKVVYSSLRSGQSEQVHIDISNLGTGVYYVVIIKDLKSYEPQRVVVK